MKILLDIKECISANYKETKEISCKLITKKNHEKKYLRKRNSQF